MHPTLRPALFLASIAFVFLAHAAGLDPRIHVIRDVAYGPDPPQRMDVYRPEPRPANAPIVAMVHGGAWIFGDKTNSQVIVNKANRWVGKGWVFVSINNRLVPDADPVRQAEDVARALAAIQKEAAGWGGDVSRITLMGHSAGGHLVALLAADPALAKSLGAKPWSRTVALDSGALDVPAIMEAKHMRFYDRAFGSDPAYWKRASPLHALTAEATPMLLVCSSRRATSCPAAHAFAAAAKKLGGRADVVEMNLSHREINETLGLDSPYTRRVEAFME